MAAASFPANWSRITASLVPLKKGKKDVSSFKYLIDETRYALTQSQLIQMGHQMEGVVKNIVGLSEGWSHVFIANKTGKKEKDHVLVNITSGKVVILEQKNNLNLDTEKCKSTANKLPRLITELSEGDTLTGILGKPPVSVEAYILGSRYVRSTHIPSVISKKYVGTRILGMDDLCDLIGVPPIFTTEDLYRSYINDVMLPAIMT
jgi:hypothetical protein